MKIGLIGVGNMGRNHARILQEEGIFDFTGLFDIDPDRAAQAAARYGTKVFKSPEELLDRVEAVVVAAPSSLHRELGLLAAARGVHALVEKPLATNSTDARTLLEAFASRNLRLAVGHIERFNPVILELDKLLEPEKVICVEARRYSPFSGSGRITDTSVIEDLMIHDAELVCHLMAPHTVTGIQGAGECVRSCSTDFASCILRFDTNAHAVLQASRISQEKERSLCIHGTDSYICADLLAKTLTIYRNTDMVLDGLHDSSYRQNGVVEKVFVPIQEPLRLELRAFYDTVREGVPPAVDGSTALRAIEICEQVAGLVEKERTTGE